jgi:hypothetical protein
LDVNVAKVSPTFQLHAREFATFELTHISLGVWLKSPPPAIKRNG